MLLVSIERLVAPLLEREARRYFEHLSPRLLGRLGLAEPPEAGREHERRGIGLARHRQTLFEKGPSALVVTEHVMGEGRQVE